MVFKSQTHFPTAPGGVTTINGESGDITLTGSGGIIITEPTSNIINIDGSGITPYLVENEVAWGQPGDIMGSSNAFTFNGTNFFLNAVNNEQYINGGTFQVYGGSTYSSIGLDDVTGVVTINAGSTSTLTLNPTDKQGVFVGGLAFPVTAVTTNTVATMQMFYLDVNTTLGVVTITLPQISRVTDGTTFVISDASGTAATNHITINPNATDKFSDQLTAQTLKRTAQSMTIHANKNLSTWVIA